MSENLNQKRKYIKKQNLNLNKTNFDSYDEKVILYNILLLLGPSYNWGPEAVT